MTRVTSKLNSMYSSPLSASCRRRLIRSITAYIVCDVQLSSIHGSLIFHLIWKLALLDLLLLWLDQEIRIFFFISVDAQNHFVPFNVGLRRVCARIICTLCLYCILLQYSVSYSYSSTIWWWIRYQFCSCSVCLWKIWFVLRFDRLQVDTTSCDCVGHFFVYFVYLFRSSYSVDLDYRINTIVIDIWDDVCLKWFYLKFINLYQSRLHPIALATTICVYLREYRVIIALALVPCILIYHI